MRSVIKWVAGTAIAAVVAFALLVPKRPNEAYRNDISRARSTAFRDYEAARSTSNALRELTMRAEARAIANALPPVSAQVPLVRIDPRVPAAVAARVRDRFASEWRATSATPARYPVALIVTVDSVMRNAILQRTIALPEQAGAPCAVVVSVSLAHVQRLAIEGAPRFLGTCAFYVAFGAPGTGASSWLRSTRAASARLQSPWLFTDDDSRIDLSSSYGFVYGDGVLVASCRAGRTMSCADLLSPDPRVPPAFDERRRALLDELADFEPATEVFWSGSLEFSGRAVQGGLLATLAAELGPERFGEIWRGPKSLAESYEAEAGRPLVAWVSDYVAKRTLPYWAGPGLPGVSTALGIALTLLAFALAHRFSLRRTS